MSDVTEHPVKLGGVHHAAYRCKDAKETVEWYGKVLGMEYTTAFAEDHVPSTGEYDPYMHVFLDAGNGNILAFFELPNQKDMGRDENTPAWVQHLAFRVGREAELLAAKDHVESLGIEVLGEYLEERLGQTIQCICPEAVALLQCRITSRDRLELLTHFLQAPRVGGELNATGRLGGVFEIMRTMSAEDSPGHVAARRAHQPEREGGE